MIPWFTGRELVKGFLCKDIFELLIGFWNQVFEGLDWSKLSETVELAPIASDPNSTKVTNVLSP